MHGSVHRSVFNADACPRMSSPVRKGCMGLIHIAFCRLRRWSLFHAQQARHREVATEIIKGASAHDLNEMVGAMGSGFSCQLLHA